MEIYLIRHAIAVKKGEKDYPNDDRPLTKAGIRKMKKAAAGIRSLVGRVDVLLSSPLSRAMETAEILAAALKHRGKIVPCDELLPGKAPGDLLAVLGKFKQTAKVMLVGHSPGIEDLVSAIVGTDHPVIELRKGGLCRIDLGTMPPQPHGLLVWHVPPKHLRAFARA